MKVSILKFWRAKMTITHIERAAEIMFSDFGSAEEPEFILSMILEALVMPQDCSSFSVESMKEYIINALKEKGVKIYETEA